MATVPQTIDSAVLDWNENTAVLTVEHDLARQTIEDLQRAFHQPFAILDLARGELNRVAQNWLPIGVDSKLGILEEVARRGTVEIIEDYAPLVVLAVPIPSEESGECRHTALATFVTQPLDSQHDITLAAQAVGVDAEVAMRWAKGQSIWSSLAVEQLSQSVLNQALTRAENQKLKRQLTSVSQHLLQTFDELNLLHRIHERLSLASNEQQLLDQVVRWLNDVLPAQCLIGCMEARTEDSAGLDDQQRYWIVAGDCPVPKAELNDFFVRLGPGARDSTILFDREVTGSPNWFYPDVREVISVPIYAGNDTVGWLLALNRQEGRQRREGEFGSLETSLLSSVASMLGMHSGNVRLFKDQEGFFESVVRAFSSAIDAKDQYTRGHSERVARISVCLARRLGCSKQQLNTIYLSGLLHDIGKIGIDDNVLQKPGKLTSEEFNHIQQHPQFGYEILKGVQQLQQVLPVVLHHHESWDGTGYPHQLAGEEIPWLARIVAVADSFDAMSSDRVYRTGMPAEKLNAIFRENAGKQWDARVVEAFFAVRKEIEEVIRESREQLSLDVDQWQY